VEESIKPGPCRLRRTCPKSTIQMTTAPPRSTWPCHNHEESLMFQRHLSKVTLVRSGGKTKYGGCGALSLFKCQCNNTEIQQHFAWLSPGYQQSATCHFSHSALSPLKRKMFSTYEREVKIKKKPGYFTQKVAALALSRDPSSA